MKRLFAFIVSACCAASAQAQMPKWCNPPVLFDWATHTQTTVTTNSPNPSAYGSNGAYDQNGNLLFYVEYYWVRSASGSQIAMLGGMPMEVNIIKVPSTCKDYYVIYALPSPMSGANVWYTRLTWNGTGWNAGANTSLTNISGSEWCNLAVSKPIGGGKNRYLFVSGNGSLGKFLIANNNISFVSNVVSNSGGIFKSHEGELFEDGNGYKYITGECYPFSSVKKIGVINMDANGNYISKQSYTSASEIHGLEFISSNQVLFSNNTSIGILDLTTGAVSNLANPTIGKNSTIEKAADGKYYAIGLDGTNRKLVELNLTTMAAAFTSYLYPNVQTSPDGTGVYKLVDQVDNEDYVATEYKADLVIKDEPLDMGIEPTLQGLYTAEGDVWNCHSSAAGACTSNQNPRSGQTEYMNVKVYNYGCATSQPAELHMYWTRARSGEIWLDHWYDPSIATTNWVNGHPGGGEITVLNGNPAQPDPVIVPPIAPGQSMTFSHEWTAPDRAWYPIDPNHDDGSNPMICFLARVYSAEDPMTLETPITVINTNVVRNNNIATRNSYLMSFPRPGGIPSPWVIQDGSFMINNPYFETRVIDRIRLTGLTFGRNIGAMQSLQLELDPNLYQRWQAGGAQGTGVVDAGSNHVLITNNKLAELTNLNIQPGEEFSLVPVIEFDANTTLKGQVDIYKFMISHYYPDGTTMSPGIYNVQFDERGLANKSSQGAGQVAKDDELVLSPNPTSDLLQIRYSKLSEGAEITLYDNLGRKVQRNVLNGTNSTISTSRLPAGVYFYQITSGKEVFKGKVVKQ